MDHVLNGLRQWLVTYEEQLQNEVDSEEHEYKDHNIKVLKEDVQAIKQAMSIISKRV